MNNKGWYSTQKGWKRKKASFYLREHIHNQLIEISNKNELSVSETANRLLEQSMRLHK